MPMGLEDPWHAFITWLLEVLLEMLHEVLLGELETPMGLEDQWHAFITWLLEVLLEVLDEVLLVEFSINCEEIGRDWKSLHDLLVEWRGC
jgi:hypothetical protein